MNSSISSFKNEVKVFLVVLIVIGTLDASRRYEFAHRQRESEAKLLNSFPVLADNLASESGTSMILLRNSLTQNGYDMPLLKTTLEAEGHGDLHVEKIAQAGSSPIEWYHNFRRIFVRRGKTPKVIVINMSPSGIADALPAGYRVGWLANETDWRDVPEVLLEDLRDIETNGQYLQARVSMLYADRWDIRIGLLYQLDHNLWPGITWVNSAQLTAKSKPVQAPPATYSVLTRMLELARVNHALTILVAMPARERYSIEPELAEILKQYKVPILDSRTIPGLTAGDFQDGWHLNPKGAKIFTVYMADQLAAAIVSDVPAEAELTPRLWGTWEFDQK